MKFKVKYLISTFSNKQVVNVNATLKFVGEGERGINSHETF